MKVLKILANHLHIVALTVASFVAVILESLKVLPGTYVVSLILVLVAVHILDDLVRGEEIHSKVKTISERIITPEPGVELIKPSEMLTHYEEFALKNRGEEWWFNVCASMFYSPDLFNKLLKPSIESSRTTSITFILKDSMREAWDKKVQPQIEKCKGKRKVRPILWRDIEENIAFRMIDISAEKETKEAFLTVWGEPFMFGPEKEKVQMTRHVLYVRSHSELIPLFKDIFIRYKLGQQP